MSESFNLLSTRQLNSEIENMLKEEKRFILILSPFLNLTDDIQSLLGLSKAKIIILYRKFQKNKEDEEENENQMKDKDKDDERRINGYKESLPNVEFYGIPDFHAKAYITNGTMIITSLNLTKSSLNNYSFELGIVLKKTSYYKMIDTLLKELHALVNMHKSDFDKFDIKMLDDLHLPTVDILFKEILKKYEKNEEDYPDAELLKQFSKQMLAKYNTFIREDRWESDKNVLQRYTKINRTMYEWALENIRL